MKSHAVRRMQEGVRKLLGLHTPVELSSICGCLQLKTQLKGADSIELIVSYVMENEGSYEDKIRKVLSYCWEGALWEYLHCIGHPVHTMLLDPKLTVFKIWENGGFLDEKEFAPHFIAREIKKRNEWIQSEDIHERLAKLAEAQELAKQAERRIIAEHDYTNILAYFKQMHNLRSMENTVREYFISELEIARSRNDSYEEVAEMQRDRLTEHEIYLVKITQALNEKLAHIEYLYHEETATNIKLQKQLYRLNEMLCSYIEADLNRDEVNGGIYQALKLKGLEEEFPISEYVPMASTSSSVISPTMNSTTTEIDQNMPFFLSCYENIQSYRNQRNTRDDFIRERSRCHVLEINELKDELQSLFQEHEVLQHRYEQDVGGYEKILNKYILQERKMKRFEDEMHLQQSIAWPIAIQNAAKVLEYEQEMKKYKPLLLAGMIHNHPLVSKICYTILTSMKGMLRSIEERNQLEELLEMSKQERHSWKQIEYLQLLQKQDELNQRAIALKTRKTTVSTNKGSPNKKSSKIANSGGGGGDDNSTVKSSNSKTSGSKPGSKPGTPASKKKDEKATTGSNKGSAKKTTKK